jgi:hypothetical protein
MFFINIMVKLKSEISEILKKFFIEYAKKTHMSNWKDPESFFRPENMIEQVIQECQAFEDMYAQKILQTIEKRLDDRLTTEKRTMEDLQKTGRFKEDSPVIMRIGSRIEAFIAMKEILNIY